MCMLHQQIHPSRHKTAAHGGVEERYTSCRGTPVGFLECPYRELLLHLGEDDDVGVGCLTRSLSTCVEEKRQEQWGRIVINGEKCLLPLDAEEKEVLRRGLRRLDAYMFKEYKRILDEKMVEFRKKRDERLPEGEKILFEAQKTVLEGKKAIFEAKKWILEDQKRITTSVAAEDLNDPPASVIAQKSKEKEETALCVSCDYHLLDDEEFPRLEKQPSRWSPRPRWLHLKSVLRGFLWISHLRRR